MDSHEISRRTLVIRKAIERLGHKDAAAFLHQPHHALGEQRPLTIAESSDIGLRAVLGLLAMLALD
ncbi:antitoxin Xre/MbcA/ParS toxin-binding domain-containing protein [Sphingomonas sp. SRS2]|uniref:antitoxin Xre/MbcA/ParS toxin-binding domain-containing protein n=1 Tax=Sphingomonas sp. SRS2 TaxID=133190 RepID=UPI00061841F1|nr:antitoxin Xre/MbcA/ParS toxin-binding domain-containing protein [Sphingomonas sp. SRS2]KKC24771.1 hypothetical protein WP12_17390 [Sphingomonas sp. SRS2]